MTKKERPASKRVGFVASCFDLFHAGHVLMLEDAKKQCDVLQVALQVDPSVDRPEKRRPVQSLYERFIQVNACRYVDHTCVYETEADLLVMLKVLKPDVRILGDDYKPVWNEEKREHEFKDVVGEEHCGDIYFHERLGYSTTELIERVLGSDGRTMHLAMKKVMWGSCKDKPPGIDEDKWWPGMSTKSGRTGITYTCTNDSQCIHKPGPECPDCLREADDE